MAIPVDQATKDALQAPVKQLRSEVSYTENDETTTLTSEDRIISIKKEAEGYYFQSTLRKITIVTTGTDMELLDKQVKVDIFVKTGTNTWGRLPWGSFNITEATVSEDKGTTTYIGYDGVYSLQTINYVGGELTFPTTVAGLAEQIAARFGIEIETDLTTLPNYDAPIAEDLWAKITGTTYRDILEEIAGATGTIAVIGRGNDILNLELPPVSEASETLTENNLITAKIGENWGKASAVVLSRQPQGDNIEVVDQATADSPGGRNLLQYPEGTNTSKGITWAREASTNTAHGVGTLTGSTYSDTLSTTIQINLPAGTYTFSIAAPLPSPLQLEFSTYDNNNTRINYQIPAGKTTRTVNFPNGLKKVNVSTIHGVIGTEYDITITNIQIEAGSTAHPYEPYRTNGRVDLVIANNEILDKQRETTAQPILDAVKGWDYRNAEIKTEGHGYHEIGDRVDISVAGETYPAVVTKSTIQVDGGIKETLISATPEIVPIDYAKAGGITKTIFNTELAVDKQHQEIEAIVSRQDQTDETITENYTRLLQTINNIQATVQVSGGGNLIKNSVGFGKQSDGTLTIWEYGAGASTTTVKSQSSTASLNAGAISGHEINITGATSTTISQDVQLTPGELYNLSFRVQKSAVGSVTVSITDGITTQTITAQDQVAYSWNQLDVDFTPANGSVTVTITANNCTAAITDLMLAQGGRTGWRQASGEIYNLQVSVDQDGVQVKSATYAGDYTAITPLEFAGYSNASGIMKKVFTINRDVTEVEKLYAKSQIKMPPMEIVPIDNANYKGWAIVKAAE